MLQNFNKMMMKKEKHQENTKYNINENRDTIY